ncbi:MAG: hypothetical protein ABW171_10810 [Steroidobacter sp.]
MLGSTMLDVAIGIVFVFVLVGTVCSAIREIIEARLKTRAAYLEQGIRELLHDREGKGLARSFFNHPLIYSLYPGAYTGPGNNTNAVRPKVFASGGLLPSYIPARSFAMALLDIAAKGPVTDEVSSDPSAPALSLESVRASVAKLKNPPVQRALLAAIDSAQGDLDRARTNIEAWFDSSMDRVSGWYKRSTQWIIFTIALVLSVGLNIDTLAIADYLYRNDSAREAVVALAGNAEENGTRASVTYQYAATQLQSLSLPIGWSGNWRRPPQATDTWYEKTWSFTGPALGWLITAFAATLGAPFWFDLLNKMMVIRSTVKPHEKSREEGSEDRQPRVTHAAAPITVQAAPAAPPQPPTVRPYARDEDTDWDGCSAVQEHERERQHDATAMDDQLPPSRGGVA